MVSNLKSQPSQVVVLVRRRSVSSSNNFQNKVVSTPSPNYQEVKLLGRTSICRTIMLITLRHPSTRGCSFSAFLQHGRTISPSRRPRPPLRHLMDITRTRTIQLLDPRILQLMPRSVLPSLHQGIVFPVIQPLRPRQSIISLLPRLRLHLQAPLAPPLPPQHGQSCQQRQTQGHSHARPDRHLILRG